MSGIKTRVNGQDKEDFNWVVPVAGLNPSGKMIPMNVDALGNAAIGTSSADYSPGYSDQSLGGGPLYTDPDGNLIIRGPVTTDELSYRDNFSGASIALAIGTCVFVNGSATVTGTALTGYDLQAGQYIKLDADAESAWAQVSSLDSATGLTLVTAYTGAGGSGATSCAVMKPTTGTGAAIAVASGSCTITHDATTGSLSEIARACDYLPVTKQAAVTISQRVANQDVYVGFYDFAHPATPYFYAWFRFNGSLANTAATCESAYNRSAAPSGNEIEVTSFTLPNNLTTATSNAYRVEVLQDRINFYVAGVRVAQHTKCLPHPSSKLASSIRVLNGTTPTTGTVVTTDYDTVNNYNRLMMGPATQSEEVIAAQPPLEAYVYNVSGIIAINTDLLIVDCAKLRSLLVYGVAGTTGVVTLYWTNDLTILGSTAPLVAVAGVSTATITTAAGQYTTPVLARYARFRLTTATTAATTTLNVFGSQLQLGPQLTQLASQNGTWTVQPGNTPNTSPWLVAGKDAQAAAITVNPNPTSGVDTTQLTRRFLADVAGAQLVVGPGESTTIFSLTGWNATPSDGTVSRVILAPTRESEIYLGFSSISTTPLFQIERSFDNITYEVMPMQRVDNTASSQQFGSALASFTPVLAAIYRGKTYGAPYIRLHSIGTSGSPHTGMVRIVPLTEVAGVTVAPFTLTAVNTTESAGTANGAIAAGGVRTLAVSGKGSTKCQLIVDASGGTTGTNTVVLEGAQSASQTTWDAITLQPVGGGATVASVSFTTALTAPAGGIWEADVSQWAFVRARMTVAMTTTPQVFGALKMINVPSAIGIGNSRKPTYAIGVSGLTHTASTNLIAIESGASKVTTIKRLVVSGGTATAAASGTLAVNRNTVAATAAGTTPTAATMQRVTTDAAFSGIVRTGSFTVVGITTVATQIVLPVPTNISTSAASIVSYDFTNGGTEEGLTIPVGVTNGIMFTHSGGGSGAAAESLLVEWTEE